MKSTFDTTPLLLFLAIFIVPINGYGARYWAKTYGVENRLKNAHSIKQTIDGGLIIGGSTLSLMPDRQNGRDIFLVKLDNSGNIIWQKTYGSSGDEEPYVIEITDDGGYIVAGYTNSFDLDSFWDVWVLKLDVGGNISWQKTYGGRHWDIVYFLQQTRDGGYVLAGKTNSFGEGPEYAWVVKLNDSGDVSWEKMYGGGNWRSIANSIQQTGEGGYIVAGYTISLASNFNISRDIWILKLDTNGDISWQKTYGGIDNDSAFSIRQAMDGGYMIAGYTRSFSPSPQIWVLKIDCSGKIQWQNTYDNSCAMSIEQTSDGGYILTGEVDVGICLLKLGKNGAVTWQKTYPASFTQGISSIAQTVNGGYAVAGDYNNGDFIVVKVDGKGEIPDCEAVGSKNPSVYSTDVEAIDADCIMQTTNAMVKDTNVIPDDLSLTITTVCEGDYCPIEIIVGSESEAAQILRYFRDNILRQTQEGRELIELYNQWSPTIVRAIERNDNFKEEVKTLIGDALLFIGSLIE